MGKPKVVVTWGDAWNDNDTIYLPEAVEELGELLVESVGFLLRDDDKGVVLCGQHNELANVYRDMNFIPRGMVRKVRLLKG
jgi:PhoPQ-activated pathogenicity-related protein